MNVKISNYFNTHYKREFPRECNYAVILGEISGYLVIDTDSPEAETWVKENIPETGMMVRTRNGFHRYYKYPTFEMPNTKKVTPMAIGKCDLKSRNSYCLIPPSKFTDRSGEYEWIAFNPEQVPEFRLEWLHKDVFKRENTHVDTIGCSSEEIKDLINKMIKAKAFISSKTLHVKTAVKILEEEGLTYNKNKTGPMESKKRNNSGYIIVDNLGLSLGSWDSGIFFRLSTNLRDQIQDYFKELENE